MKIVTVEQMRRIDERVQSEWNITGYELMVAAGHAIVEMVERRYKPQTICIICGKGNNAGDALVAARLFHDLGRHVLVVCLEEDSAYVGPALQAWKDLGPAKPEILSVENLHFAMERSEVIIDALLGTGIRGAVRDPYASVIESINRAGKPIVSVDVPSGLQDNFADGEVPSIVRASVTATIGLSKKILLTYPGFEFAGDVEVLPINFPTALLESPEWQLNAATTADMETWLPDRKPDSHKGTHGHVGIIGSALNYAGASILTARGALRTGCGLATIYALPGANAIYKGALPEATSIILSSREDNFFDLQSAEDFNRLHKSHTVLAIGPGLGNAPETKDFLVQVLKIWNGPLILDADALTLLSDGLLHLIKDRPDCLLTPHPGEMSRLTGLKTSEIQADRENTVRQFAADHGVTALLKGTGTFVSRPDGQVWLVSGSEPALAKGGTGDVLTGVIASLFAQGMSIDQAAVLGAYAHLESGHRCSVIKGSRGVLASDVADEIPCVLDDMIAHSKGEHHR